MTFHPLPWSVAALSEGRNPFGRPSRPGELEHLAEDLADDLDTPGGREIVDRWLAEVYPRLANAQDETDIANIFDDYKTRISAPVSEARWRAKEEADRAELRQKTRHLEKLDAYRRRYDPGPVSSVQAAQRWVRYSAQQKPVYHATMNGPVIMATGIKARQDLPGYYQALGGGPDDLISTVEDPRGAALVAAALSAMNESYSNGDAVYGWFLDHWLTVPGVTDVPALVRKLRENERTYADSAHNPKREPNRIRYLINDVCLFFIHGEDRTEQYPNMVVPIIMAAPAETAPKNIGFVELYANVDTIVGNRRVLAGYGQGLEGQGVESINAQRPKGGRGRDSFMPARSLYHTSAKFLERAHVGKATESGAELGEIRFAPEDLTVTEFWSTSDWRRLLMPGRVLRENGRHTPSTRRRPSAVLR